MSPFLRGLLSASAAGGGGGDLPVAGALLNVDAQALVGYSDGDTVNTWPDLSGNGNDGTRATGGGTLAIAYRTSGINGHPALEFTASGGNVSYFTFADFLRTPGITAAEVFLVLRSTSASGSQTGLWTMQNNGELPTHYPFSDGNVYDSFGTTARKSLGNIGVTFSTAHVYQVATASGAWQAWVDGASVFSTATNTVGWPSTPELGFSRYGAGGYPFKGYVGQLVIFPFTLTSGERTDMLDNLSTKWGTP